MIKWDEYLLYKKLTHVHEMHMDEGTNMLGKTQNNSGKTETFNHPILNLSHKQQGLQSCLDRTIIAVIEYQDKIYIGTNGIINVPTQCPRSGCTINQGYELCRTVCHQPYHAEESAIVD